MKSKYEYHFGGSLRSIFLTLSCGLLLIFSISAYAFNWEACHKRWAPAPGLYGAFGVFYSTSSWTSSTQECSMLPFDKTQEKIKYINDNFDQIKFSASEGKGEYVDTLASLYNCDDEEIVDLFKTKIKSNYLRVFDKFKPGSGKDIIQQIDRLIFLNPKLYRECWPKRWMVQNYSSLTEKGKDVELVGFFKALPTATPLNLKRENNEIEFIQKNCSFIRQRIASSNEGRKKIEDVYSNLKSKVAEDGADVVILTSLYSPRATPVNFAQVLAYGDGYKCRLGKNLPPTRSVRFLVKGNSKLNDCEKKGALDWLEEYWNLEEKDKTFHDEYEKETITKFLNHMERLITKKGANVARWVYQYGGILKADYYSLKLYNCRKTTHFHKSPDWQIHVSTDTVEYYSLGKNNSIFPVELF